MEGTTGTKPPGTAPASFGLMPSAANYDSMMAEHASEDVPKTPADYHVPSQEQLDQSAHMEEQMVSSDNERD